MDGREGDESHAAHQLLADDDGIRICPGNGVNDRVVGIGEDGFYPFAFQNFGNGVNSLHGIFSAPLEARWTVFTGSARRIKCRSGFSAAVQPNLA